MKISGYSWCGVPSFSSKSPYSCADRSVPLRRALAHSAQLLGGHRSDGADHGRDRAAAGALGPCGQLFRAVAGGPAPFQAAAARQRHACQQHRAGQRSSHAMPALESCCLLRWLLPLQMLTLVGHMNVSCFIWQIAPRASRQSAGGARNIPCSLEALVWDSSVGSLELVLLWACSAEAGLALVDLHGPSSERSDVGS